MDTTTNMSINSTAAFSCSHSKQPVNNKKTRTVRNFFKREAAVLPAEMPIASGAAGRVETCATWTPDGLKRKTKPANRNHDSYLQRFQELKQSKKNKSKTLQETQENTDVSSHENDGAKGENLLENGGIDGHASLKPSSRERSRKSQLCVLL